MKYADVSRWRACETGKFFLVSPPVKGILKDPAHVFTAEPHDCLNWPNVEILHSNDGMTNSLRACK